MDTALFDFDLPERVIAQAPLAQRDGARLLHVTPDAMADSYIYKLPELLNERDVLVFNNSRVIPARLFGMRDEVKIEILLHKQDHSLHWRAFAKPAKRLKIGHTITFDDDFSATVTEKFDTGEVGLHFMCGEDAFWDKLKALGHIPLPPYIARSADNDDAERYQTVYAEHDGSVAAPTAGLHFTDHLIKTLKDRNIAMHYVTLHVGGGTFLPVKADDTDDHVMHSEYGVIDANTAAALNAAKAEGRRVVSVGTTSLRILESATDETGIIHPYSAETDIFITPGYRFRAVDRMLTNFHLPKSTLFMLVSAFAGLEKMQNAYHHAISNDYRFYSYGDACLLERSNAA